jgi:hypothetical protein
MVVGVYSKPLSQDIRFIAVVSKHDFLLSLLLEFLNDWCVQLSPLIEV